MLQAIGIDIGGTKIRVASVAADGKIKSSMTSPTPANAGDIVAAIESMIPAMNGGGKAAAIGIGVPARVDVLRGEIYPGGFIDLSKSKLSNVIRQKTGLKVFIDNDASMALVGEARVGAAHGLANVILLTIGTGIGGAIMANGRILHGRATAGQLGHVTVDFDGAPCRCGRNGCVETTSSGTALRRLIVDGGLPEETLMADLLASEESSAKSILRAWALPLRSAIDSLVAAFDPNRVVLGGGLGIEAVQALSNFPARSNWFQCDIVAAKLGDNAGVIGAALASLDSAS